MVTATERSASSRNGEIVKVQGCLKTLSDLVSNCMTAREECDIVSTVRDIGYRNALPFQRENAECRRQSAKQNPDTGLFFFFQIFFSMHTPGEFRHNRAFRLGLKLE